MPREAMKPEGCLAPRIVAPATRHLALGTWPLLSRAESVRAGIKYRRLEAGSIAQRGGRRALAGEGAGGAAVAAAAGVVGHRGEDLSGGGAEDIDLHAVVDGHGLGGDLLHAR